MPVLLLWGIPTLVVLGGAPIGCCTCTKARTAKSPPARQPAGFALTASYLFGSFSRTLAC